MVKLDPLVNTAPRVVADRITIPLVAVPVFPVIWKSPVYVPAWSVMICPGDAAESADASAVEPDTLITVCPGPNRL
jgi:hypothetical protein